ncbi:BZ3500_MvSof-1268-A1-R1_Chr5-3g08169 [Microbotryum saponariae]|uniref:BZ3500_MvSof-1268-A1-R1_Chr5-3g08169 protein n=1 Tax=Microbotryum saponariae TaxID=289078 RepID=A0A2X0LR42_9BASI|nr:BZ3500_MvSof-1268-A1-R1_Chr5-3g08169 [Microbotryum saponariae]SDA07928.1 BZ3501_MvSof-1269-A2-R1_Chr5-1g07313 [Microbotryum saponariae]
MSAALRGALRARRGLLFTSLSVGASATTLGLAAWAVQASYHEPLRLEAPHALKKVPTALVGEKNKTRVISMEEVRTHRSKADCWVVLGDHVYDVTEFLEAHASSKEADLIPGGEAVILKAAGTDVTTLFDKIHPPKTLEKNRDLLGAPVGLVDPATRPKDEESDEALQEKARIQIARETLPAVELVRGLAEMERLANTLLAPRAKIYYAGGSDDEQTLRDSFASYQRCRFRPRVLVDVSEIDPRTTLLNCPSTLPIYIAPAAYARLGHDLGEFNLTRGASKTGIVQGISANASQSFDDILAEKATMDESGRAPVGMVYQVYVNRDRRQTEAIMKQAREGGCKAFFLTVDSPTLGNREEDARAQGLAGSMDDRPHDHPNKSTYSYYDTSVEWKDVAWVKQAAGGLPVYIKGVATHEDVELARKAGVAGVILSNHGGRQLDSVRSPLDTLLEIRRIDPTLLTDLEVYVDGGVRRGTDVLKALCLGARGVGLGRPFLYAQTAYGEDGVVRAVRIMEEEILTGMRLLGVKRLSELRPELVECLDNQYRIPK